MVSVEALKDILHQKTLTKADRILICLFVDPDQPKPIWQIKELAAKGGLPEAKKWNVSGLLARSHGKAVRIDDGWILTLEGKEYIRKIIEPFVKAPVSKIVTSLRSHLGKISNPDTHAFVEEAIECCEAGLWRAAVVLSWVGAILVLYDYVVNNKLADFNKEATGRYPDWKVAKTKDHLARMKESDFLLVLEGISLIGKNLRKELAQCLDLRNACGHPSTLSIGEHRTAGHIEVLILNVFSKFHSSQKTTDQTNDFVEILFGYASSKRNVNNK